MQWAAILGARLIGVSLTAWWRCAGPTASLNDCWPVAVHGRRYQHPFDARRPVSRLLKKSPEGALVFWVAP